jgi:hypothetical protein
MPEFSERGVDRGLVRLRLGLSQSQPELVGRAQAALTTLIRGLVDAAAASGRIQVVDLEAATFMILSLNAAFITAETVGNDAGVNRPDIAELTSFCLRGLGARLADGWYEAIDGRLQLPGPRLGHSGPPANMTGSRPAGRRRAQKS